MWRVCYEQTHAYTIHKPYTNKTNTFTKRVLEEDTQTRNKNELLKFISAEIVLFCKLSHVILLGTCAFVERAPKNVLEINFWHGSMCRQKRSEPKRKRRKEAATTKNEYEEKKSER